MTVMRVRREERGEGVHRQSRQLLPHTAQLINKTVIVKKNKQTTLLLGFLSGYLQLFTPKSFFFFKDYSELLKLKAAVRLSVNMFKHVSTHVLLRIVSLQQLICSWRLNITPLHRGVLHMTMEHILIS